MSAWRHSMSSTKKGLESARPVSGGSPPAVLVASSRVRPLPSSEMKPIRPGRPAGRRTDTFGKSHKGERLLFLLGLLPALSRLHAAARSA
jgi:hypothetical protein